MTVTPPGADSCRASAPERTFTRLSVSYVSFLVEASGAERRRRVTRWRSALSVRTFQSSELFWSAALQDSATRRLFGRTNFVCVFLGGRDRPRYWLSRLFRPPLIGCSFPSFTSVSLLKISWQSPNPPHGVFKKMIR